MLTLAVFKRVGKVPVVKERLNKSASCSEISFLSIFKTLHRILYGPVNLLISREERINLISSLLVNGKMCQDFHLRGNQHTFCVNVFFLLGSFHQWHWNNCWRYLLFFLDYQCFHFKKWECFGGFEKELFTDIILLMPFKVFLRFFKLFSKNLVK